MIRIKLVPSIVRHLRACGLPWRRVPWATVGVLRLLTIPAS